MFSPSVFSLFVYTQTSHDDIFVFLYTTTIKLLISLDIFLPCLLKITLGLSMYL